MNEPQGNSGCAWLALLGIGGLICAIYPPFLGVVLGYCFWLVPIAFLCYVLGHRGRIV